ncbi:CREB/ATF bZIP transcription factor [Anolis carolinensis]|uniref:CREB/ATF bZIP transcription factor n=1 Tax=Anolis carolinensis TaxID=28377 RepID=A0A803T702_ANOCA|nr:PREDICTED: CREB/ATF bZIP transcription factor [Anolis carolinensis]|eukprot:XP_008106344.1 PREDICTED: CREB/ATF bZIP transcription factor [Anolis carolinensis]
MRQSLAQIMASSSGGESPRDPAASPSEAGRDEDELLFPPDLGLGLDLDGWLEAAMTEGPDLEPPHCHHPHPSRPSNRLKAAAAARLNRQKKKQYVLGLESRLQGLAAENRLLRDRNRGLCRRLRDLERETGYLRAVLANQSALGRLLSCLAGSQGAGRVGMRLSSSLFAQEEGPVPEEEARLAWESSSSNSSDHDYALPVPEDDQEEEENNHNNNKRVAAAAASSSSPAGICLHVDRDQVSVEFCSLCARRAAATSTSSSSFASKIFSFRYLPCQAPLCRG